MFKKGMMNQLSKIREQMQQTEVEGEAGNGLVKITLNGERQLKGIKIKPECVDPDDTEALEDLVTAAYSDALEKLSAAMPMPF